MDNQLKIVTNTYLKAKPLQSKDLPFNDLIELPAGIRLALNDAPKQMGDHLHVKVGFLGQVNIEGYIYAPHVEGFDFEHPKPDFRLQVGARPTWFKTSTAQAVTLSPEDKCLVRADTELKLKVAGVKEGKHVKVVLDNAEDLGCEFTEGYFYLEHLFFINLEPPKPPKPDNKGFEKVMSHILKWEGGCSDHPNDPGGRTFMGITTARARENGWYDDVCKMPKSMVMDIYREDYWEQRPFRYQWPLNLAVMNTEVNSGGGRAQQFIRRMIEQRIQGDAKAKAKWFVDQQTEFYKLIAHRNPKLRVFLRGWLNRSAYMQRVIADS